MVRDGDNLKLSVTINPKPLQGGSQIAKASMIQKNCWRRSRIRPSNYITLRNQESRPTLRDLVFPRHGHRVIVRIVLFGAQRIYGYLTAHTGGALKGWALITSQTDD